MGEWKKNDKDIHFGDGVNWDAASHQQLWEWFSQPRLAELEGWVDSFNDKVAAHFQAAADQVDQALRAAGVHWEGAAADAMRAASTPLAEHALRAKEAAAHSGVTTLSQVMHARNTAMAIPEPQPVPDQSIPLTASPGELIMLLKDVYEQEAAASEAESRARDLARSYDTAADDAVISLPRFEPAPSATVSGVEPADVLVVDDRPRDFGSGPEQDSGPGPGDQVPGPGDPVRPDGRPDGPTAGSSSPPPGLPGDTPCGQSWTPGGTPAGRRVARRGADRGRDHSRSRWRRHRGGTGRRRPGAGRRGQGTHQPRVPARLQRRLLGRHPAGGARRDRGR